VTFDALELTYTVTLSDGRTCAELVPYGRRRRVAFSERWHYARLVARARFGESAMQMHAIRSGLLSVVGISRMQGALPSPLSILSWQELELRLCGQAVVDIQVLKDHTVYAPKEYTKDSPIVKDFWKVLEGFSHGDRSSFLQFAWARSRLPADPNDFSWRMQLSIMEGSTQAVTDQKLPQSETCFFNVVVPKYSSFEILRKKLMMALGCTEITS